MHSQVVLALLRPWHRDWRSAAQAILYAFTVSR
jgi:hypothetical protein